MRKVSLDKLVRKLESGSRPRGGVDERGDIFSLGGEHLTYNADFNWKNKKYISNEYFSKLKSGKIQTDDILIVKDGATTGKVCFVDDTFPFEKAAINEHLFRLEVDSSKVNPHYLFWFLYSKDGQKEILKDLRGATVGGISRKFISLADIPLPESKAKQDNIANLLNKAHKLIQDRKQSISIVDELVKSVFLEMFGDPKLNSKGWEHKPIKSFGKVITGNTPKRAIKEYYNQDHIEWIKTDNIANRVIVSKAKEYLSEEGALAGRLVKNNSLLVTCIAGSLNSIGNAALTDREVAFNQQINAIVPNKDIAPYFLYWLFRLSKQYIQKNATEGMKKIITKGNFEKIKLIKPSFEKQHEFALIAEKAYNQKQKLEKSLDDSEQLFKSLLQKAFRGELEFVDENVELQTSLKTINWYESQLSLLKATQAIVEQQRQIEKVLSEPLKNIKAVQETIQKMNLPALEAIKSFQKTLNSLKVPALDAIKTIEQFQIVKDSSTQLGIAEGFKIPAFEEYQEEQRLKEIEEELSRENDPVLKYISETQAGKITFANYNVNMPRFIHEEFKRQGFTFEEIINRLGDNYGLVNINEGNVKKELFNSFKVFIRKEFNESAFTFNGLAKKLEEKLFNPSFELLHEFIIQELQFGKEIKQAYFPGVMNTEYPEHYKQLKYSESPFRLYLIHTNGNSKN